MYTMGGEGGGKGCTEAVLMKTVKVKNSTSHDMRDCANDQMQGKE